MFLAVVLSILVLALAWFYRDRRKTFSELRNFGIPGPPPSLLSGNLREILEKGLAAAADSWIRKYGNIVGFYSGSVPYVLVNDVDLAKKIFVEEPNIFQARGTTMAILDCHPVINKNFSMVGGQRWKEMRSIISPAFKPSNLKETFLVMSTCVDDLITNLQDSADNGTAINVDDPCALLTLEVIMRCAMGVETDFLKGGTHEERELISKVSSRRHVLFTGKFRILLNCFAEFPGFWRFLLFVRSVILRLPVYELMEYIQTVIDIRRSKYRGTGSTALDLMLSAENADQVSPRNTTSETTISTTRKKESDTISNSEKPSISTVEILSNTLLLLIVGFETTSNALGFTLYLLAKHADFQEKARDEASAVLQKHGEFNYENVTGMEYLDQVISESLRIYPPTIGVTSRKASKEFVHKSIRIPEGTSVLLPTFQLHHNPNFWPDPEKFDPERFSPARRATINPITYQPFGYGHRVCVGARFARLELMLSLAKVLTKYRLFVDEDHHKGDLNFSSWFMESYPKGGIWIKFKNI